MSFGGRFKDCNIEDLRSGRSPVLKPGCKIRQGRFNPFCKNPDAVVSIDNPSGNSVLLCQAEYKWPETDSLHQAGDVNIPGLNLIHMVRDDEFAAKLRQYYFYLF